MGEVTGLKRPVVPLGPALSELSARVLELLPGPLLTRDNLASMKNDAVCNGALPSPFTFAPNALEAIAPIYLSPSAMRSRYDRIRSRSR